MPARDVALFLALLASTGASSSVSDSLDMVIVADFPFRAQLIEACADADHDGHGEVYVRGGTEPWPWYVIEHVMGNEYDSVRLNDEGTRIEQIGDIDRDGLVDIVSAAYWEHRLFVFESQDSHSLPLSQVWVESIGQASPFFPAITDLDGDSLNEIAVNREDPSRCLELYECAGDNDYQLKMVVPFPGRGALHAAQAFDMDGDGIPELAFGAGRNVAFFESVGDDSLIFLDTVRMLDSTLNCYCQAVAPAADMDRDGDSELVTATLSWNDQLFKIAVLESHYPDSFEVVWADTSAPGDLLWALAVGDVNGDSTPEFAVTNGAYVRLYCCIGNDSYECFWRTDSGGSEVTLYDINSDGRDELIHAYRGRTIIREWLPVGVEERAAEKLRQVETQPSVVRGRGAVRISGLPPSAEVEVVDASGRIVASGSSGASSFVLGTLDLKAGAYFIRIRVGNQAIVRKVLVVD